MPPQQQRPQEENWPITRDDKVQIQALGRELHEFLNKKFEGKEAVHIKIVVGAFNYIMGLQQQRTKLIGDDFVLAQKSVLAAKIQDQVEEPFEVEPELPEPTREERRAALEQQIAELDLEEAGEEVADASPAPSDSPAPEVEAPVVTPVGTPEAVAATAAAPVAEAPVEAAAIQDKPAQPAG